MFIMKGNSSLAAIPCAGYDDVQYLETVGIKGILKLPNAKAILTRLVNSGYLTEGKYGEQA